MAIDDVINRKTREVQDSLGVVPTGNYYGVTGVAGLTPRTTGRDMVNRPAPETISDRFSQVLPSNPYQTPTGLNPMGPDKTYRAATPASTPLTRSESDPGYYDQPMGHVVPPPASPEAAPGMEGITYTMGAPNLSGDAAARARIMREASGPVPNRPISTTQTGSTTAMVGGRQVQLPTFRTGVAEGANLGTREEWGTVRPISVTGEEVVPTTNAGIEGLMQTRQILADQVQGFRLPPGATRKDRDKAAKQLIDVDAQLAHAANQQQSMQAGIIQKQGELGVRRQEAATKEADRASRLQLDLGKFNTDLQKLGIDTRKMVSEERWKENEQQLAGTKNESDRMRVLRDSAQHTLMEGFQAGVKAISDLGGPDSVTKINQLIGNMMQQYENINLNYAPVGVPILTMDGRRIVKQEDQKFYVLNGERPNK